MGKRITSHRELEVYQKAFQASMSLFEVSQSFLRAVTSHYLEAEPGRSIYQIYDEVIRMLIAMRLNVHKWIIDPSHGTLHEQGESYGLPF